VARAHAALDGSCIGKHSHPPQPQRQLDTIPINTSRVAIIFTSIGIISIHEVFIKLKVS
jgi:hypothetical protein